MAIEFGQLYKHFRLDGLFIVVDISSNRVGLCHSETGRIRYIDHGLVLHLYTFIA